MPANTALAATASAYVEEIARVQLRPEILEPVIEQIAKKYRRGWDPARIALWMQNLVCESSPVTQRWFIGFVTAQLAAPPVAVAA